MRLAVVVLSLLLLVSCEPVGFYSQAVRGQLEILGKRESINRLVEDETTDSDLKGRLENILAIREFAGKELGLPVKKNFSTYADLDRPFVVWNVFAALEFSLAAKNWCFPIAGCVSYRGYFSETSARIYGQQLEKEGYDVWVGGVAAYSTLGWFSDSVLNTVIHREEYRLAALIFHELAHQVVYIPGDTEFNESFATVVEQEGLRRWLDTQTDFVDAGNLVEKARQERGYRQEFVDLVQSYRPQLEVLYARDIPNSEKREEKAQIIDRMRQEYQQVKQNWQGYDAYDAWFSGEINNAKLNTVSAYNKLVPGFESLLVDSGNSLPAFYIRVESLAELSKDERDAAVKAAAP